MTYVTALGQDIIVLNSLEVAVELMERRSAKYSDRPAWEMPKLYVVVIVFLFPLLSVCPY